MRWPQKPPPSSRKIPRKSTASRWFTGLSASERRARLLEEMPPIITSSTRSHILSASSRFASSNWKSGRVVRVLGTTFLCASASCSGEVRPSSLLLPLPSPPSA